MRDDSPFRFKSDDPNVKVIVLDDYKPDSGMYVPREEAARIAAGATSCSHGDCPLCDMERTKHAEECPADILRKIAEDVATKTGLDVDYTSFDRLIYGNSFEQDGERVDPRRVIVVGTYGVSHVQQMHETLRGMDVMILPMEAAPGDVEARMAELLKTDPLERVYKLQREVMPDLAKIERFELERPRTAPASIRETLRGQRPKRQKHKPSRGKRR